MIEQFMPLLYLKKSGQIASLGDLCSIVALDCIVSYCIMTLYRDGTDARIMQYIFKASKLTN